MSKSFPGVKALDNVSFRADGGRVLALMGENGAGKSTLLKILAGDYFADEGEFLLNGILQNFTSPYSAIMAGISVVYQERQMIPALSVMENIFAGALPKNKLGLIDKPRLKKETMALINKFELSIDPSVPVGSLSVAHQQMVEIMKAYRRGSAVIAFDEPTASLAEEEITVLFKLIEALKKEGKIVIYVSHRMPEIFELSDDIVVLKDGALVTTFITSETTVDELITSMVGRDIGDTYENLSRNTEVGETLLEIKNLVTHDVHNIDFSLKRGEIIGFAGLIGAGRTELVRAIFGANEITSGEIIFEGQKIDFKSPFDAIKAGFALCPEDRKEEGLVLYRSITDNVSIPVLSKIRKALILDRKAEAKLASTAVEKYAVKTPGIDKLVVELSGGNQQKVILGRWTNELMNTKLLILDEPTKGIDVGAKAEIYQTICDFAKQGIGVIFISSELTEVIGVADRIYVMRNGRITGCVDRSDATEEGILSLAMADKDETGGDAQ
ncbi:MAG: sugar ABC transporter ATP-binding protein [Oscillospiraceae bacterium]|nr:sugar ABC transporter ATP-binding protein [Oscillospiraceae bacterium]